MARTLTHLLAGRVFKGAVQPVRGLDLFMSAVSSIVGRGFEAKVLVKGVKLLNGVN